MRENVGFDLVEVGTLGIDLVVDEVARHDLDYLVAAVDVDRADGLELRIRGLLESGIEAGGSGADGAGSAAGQSTEEAQELGLLELTLQLHVFDTLLIHLKKHAVLAAHDEGVEQIACRT